jgi:hypothetical protein
MIPIDRGGGGTLSDVSSPILGNSGRGFRCRPHSLVIRSQVDGLDAKPHLHAKKLANIFETAGESDGSSVQPNFRADVKPQAIRLRRVVAGQTPSQQSEEVVEIVVDAAGNVRSARVVGNRDLRPCERLRRLEVHPRI